MNLCSLRNESLTSFLTSPFDDTATTFSLHPSAESVLTLTTAFGGLISTFHDRSIFSMILPVNSDHWRGAYDTSYLITVKQGHETLL